MALLVHRINNGGAMLSALDVLEMATKGGAKVLGRDDIGMIAPGKAADMVVYSLDDVALAGSIHDPIAALLFCLPSKRPDLVMVNGQVVVRQGKLTGLDEHELVQTANRVATELTRRVNI